MPSSNPAVTNPDAQMAHPSAVNAMNRTIGMRAWPAGSETKVRASGVSGPAVSQVLAGLAEAGQIQRQPVPTDRRVTATLNTLTADRSRRGAHRTAQRTASHITSEATAPSAALVSASRPS